MDESSSRFPAKQSEQIFEYLFVIGLEDVKKEVVQLKRQLFDVLEDNYPGYKSTPHITLFNIASDERMNDILAFLNISWMPSFDIRLKGFDYYQHGQKSRTIYVNIEDKQSIIYMQHWLADFFRLKAHHYDPHVTIGRTFPISKFEKAWKVFRGITFEKKLMCQRITVLRRKQQSGMPLRWEEFRSIPLGIN